MESKISINKLYNLFFTKNLVKLDKYEPRTPTKKLKTEYIEPLTPTSKIIFNTVSPRSKEYIRKNMEADTISIRKMEEKIESDDSDYIEKMENGGLGFFMENILSFYGSCPVCGENT